LIPDRRHLKLEMRAAREGRVAVSLDMNQRDFRPFM